MLKPSKRTPLGVVYDLLSSAEEPRKKTKIHRQTRLSYPRFLKYLALLLEQDLIEEIPYVRTPGRGGKRYKKQKTTCLYVRTEGGAILCDFIERAYDILGWEN